MTIQDRETFTTLAATIDDVSETGMISGIAVKYGVVIKRGEYMTTEVDPGAFSRQLADPGRVKILWQHDHYEPIGRAVSLDDTARELRITAQLSLSPDVPAAAKALALLRDGMIDELSVGFEWDKYDTAEKNGVYHVRHRKARLKEVSLVTSGALGQDARVLTVASVGQTRSEQIHLLRKRAERLLAKRSN